MSPDTTLNEPGPQKTDGNPGISWIAPIMAGIFFLLLQIYLQEPAQLIGKPWLDGGIPTISAAPTQTGSVSVGIVAGHQGNDTGAVCPDGLTEVSVNLEIAERVKANLQAAGYDAVLLNEFDERLNGFRAAALVSIHNDTCVYLNDQASGYKVHAASDSQMSTRLATCLSTRYSQATGLEFNIGSITADMTSYHTFFEIDPGTPTVVIEAGFLNLDRTLLVEDPGRVADGITDGITCFLRNEDPSTTP